MIKYVVMRSITKENDKVDKQYFNYPIIQNCFLSHKLYLGPNRQTNILNIMFGYAKN